jgi:hypothetical protein
VLALNNAASPQAEARFLNKSSVSYPYSVRMLTTPTMRGPVVHGQRQPALRRAIVASNVRGGGRYYVPSSSLLVARESRYVWGCARARMTAETHAEHAWTASRENIILTNL